MRRGHGVRKVQRKGLVVEESDKAFLMMTDKRQNNTAELFLRQTDIHIVRGVRIVVNNILSVVSIEVTY